MVDTARVNVTTPSAKRLALLRDQHARLVALVTAEQQYADDEGCTRAKVAA